MKSYLKNISTVLMIMMISFFLLTVYNRVDFAVNKSNSTDYSLDTAYEYPIITEAGSEVSISETLSDNTVTQLDEVSDRTEISANEGDIINKRVVDKGNLTEAECFTDDLVYRKYSWGHYLEEGYELLIEKEKIMDQIEDVQKVIIVWDDKGGNEEYREISFDNNDIAFLLEKSGNYTILAGDLDGKFVDISSIVKVNSSSANLGVILLDE